MFTDGAAEEAVLKILVADGSAFQRRLTTETLRAAGRVQIDYVQHNATAFLQWAELEA